VPEEEEELDDTDELCPDCGESINDCECEDAFLDEDEDEEAGDDPLIDDEEEDDDDEIS